MSESRVRLTVRRGSVKILHETRDKNESASLHRLLYIAENGTGSLSAGEKLEHIDGIRWDNRPGNIRKTSSRPPRIRTDSKGYEIFYCNSQEQQHRFFHHRLLYVAEHGLAALDRGDHVHHKNGLRWDNRPENLEAVDGKLHFWHHCVAENIGSVRDREEDYRDQRRREGVADGST